MYFAHGFCVNFGFTVSISGLLLLLQLDTLKLGWCKIGPDEGASAVADLIMFNTSLSSLDLRGNNLGDRGASAIAQSMKGHENDRFTELDMGYNEIKDEGAFALAMVSTLLS